MIQQSRAVLDEGKKAAEKASTMRQAVWADESETVAKRHMVIREQAYRITKGALANIQTHTERLTEKIAKLDDLCAGPVAAGNATDQLRISEVRSVLRGMATAQRNAVIKAAVEGNDKLTLMAISRAPFYVCGFGSDLEQQTALQAWALKHQPEAVAYRTALSVALEATERGGRLLLAHANGLSSTKIAVEAERLSLQARAALAAAE